MNKEEFLQKLRSEQSHWEEFLASIPVAQRQQAGACGKWSVADVVGHVAAWERFVIGLIRAQIRNEKVTPHELWGEFIPTPGLADDALNEWMAEQIGGRSFDQMLGMQREVRVQTIATVQAMSEHTLTAPEVQIAGLSWKSDKPLWQEIGSMGYNHARLHMEGLKDWLQGQ